MRKAMKLYRMEEKAVFKIGEGETSEVFSIGGGKVVKLIKEDMYDVNEFESEYKIAKFMGETADFTPKVFDKVYLDSRHGYTMEEISGSLFQDENLIVIDWAEPSLGSSLHDVARTINFIVDTTSFPKSIVTKNSTAFVKAYLEGYYPDGKVEKDLLHKSFLINAASEIAWAERSGQWDAYSEYLKQLIIENFESNQSIYIDSFKHF